ncbi:MAG: hypothetical protein KatS3mg057_0431 [Herpetosiphonaceae bacterium]|nr:MAG: hypothetical protein KatS3mg057_0431 [Herpetosiphonaceae bacterium]
MNGDGEKKWLFGPREFTEELAERLEQVPGVEKVARRHLALQVLWHGRPLLIELEHFYTLYRKQPEQFEEIVQALIGAVRAEAPDRRAFSFDEIKGRIYPMFKPIQILFEIRERKLPMLVYRPFYADLIVAFVIDEGRSVVYINEEHTAAWGVTEPTVYQQAIENLRERTARPGITAVVGEGARRLMIYNTGDGYDAARLLVTDLLEEWQEHFPGRMVIGIPNRDFLIGFSDADPAILRQVAQQIALDATHREYGLTDQLFTLVDGRIELYEYTMSGDHV